MWSIFATQKVNELDESGIYFFFVKESDGQEQLLSDYKGKTLLIVNTASHCGFTPQFAGLEQLYQKYKNLGFVILAFPCNQFGRQEPGRNAEIQQFCHDNYQIHFPVMSKIEVNGRKTHPLFKYLKRKLPGVFGSRIWWNFTKFLVSAEGKPIRRFSPWTSPIKIDRYLRAKVFK